MRRLLQTCPAGSSFARRTRSSPPVCSPPPERKDSRMLNCQHTAHLLLETADPCVQTISDQVISRKPTRSIAPLRQFHDLPKLPLWRSGRGTKWNCEKGALRSAWSVCIMSMSRFSASSATHVYFRVATRGEAQPPIRSYKGALLLGALSLRPHLEGHVAGALVDPGLGFFRAMKSRDLLVPLLSLPGSRSPRSCRRGSLLPASQHEAAEQSSQHAPSGLGMIALYASLSKAPRTCKVWLGSRLGKDRPRQLFLPATASDTWRGSNHQGHGTHPGGQQPLTKGSRLG